MADVKITGLPASIGANITDLFEVSNAGVSEKLSLAQILALLISHSPVQQGAAPPVAPPADNTMPIVYTDLSTGDIYTWNVVTQAWI